MSKHVQFEIYGPAGELERKGVFEFDGCSQGGTPGGMRTWFEEAGRGFLLGPRALAIATALDVGEPETPERTYRIHVYHDGVLVLDVTTTRPPFARDSAGVEVVDLFGLDGTMYVLFCGAGTNIHVIE